MILSFYPGLRIAFYFFTFVFSALSVNAQPVDPGIFRDDFERPVLGSFWEENASWSIVDGSAYNFVGGSGGALVTSAGYPQTSYIIETFAKGFTANHYREFWITFGQDELNSSALYQLKYTAYFGGRLTLSKSIDNFYDPQVLDEVAVFPNLNSFDWYTFKIVKYKSGLIQVYLDQGAGYNSTPLLEAIDMSYAQLGHVGWQVDTQSFPEDFYVDWISAAIPEIEKPAVKEKPVEDNLITQVSAKSGQPYTVAKLVPGVKQLIDRTYTITSIPAYLTGASFIQTANEDKSDDSESFLSFFVKKAAIVYVAYDSRSTSIPAWLNSWTKIEDSIGTSDQNAGYLTLYGKLFEGFGRIYPFPIILGGNLSNSVGASAQTNYLIAAVERPASMTLQAEDALLSGAVVAKNHLNYNGTGFVDFIKSTGEFIEWTVQIDVPGSYNLGFTFANGNPVERNLRVTDNGEDAGMASFPQVSLSWSSWAFNSGPVLYLSAGVHKIRLSSTGTSGPNVDQLSLYFLSPAAGLSTANPVSLLRNSPPSKLVSTIKPNTFPQAYPNPFLYRTNIYYTLKERSKVILSVYTLQGQQIQLLHNGVREAGTYQATFDAGNFARGIYLYRLQTGSEVRTGRLIKE